MEWNATAVVASVSIIVSLTVAVVVFFEKRKSDKVSKCFQIHGYWTSSHMLDCREEVWYWLKGISSIKREEIRKAHKEMDLKLGAIEYFFGDLRELMRYNIIDRELAQALFGDTIQRWKSRFHDIEWDRRSDDDDVVFYWEKIDPLWSEFWKSSFKQKIFERLGFASTSYRGPNEKGDDQQKFDG
jgi:hypothetical protein